MDLGILKVPAEEDDTRFCSQTRWRSGQNLREGGRTWSGNRIGRIQSKRQLASGHGSLRQSVVDGRINNAAVVKAIAAAQHGFGVAKDVKRKADTRAKVVGVAGHVCRSRSERIH